MALETGIYLSDLVPANPDGPDDLAFGDDHLRLMKKVLQNTFPTASKALRLQVASSRVASALDETLTADDEGKCILAAATGTDAQTVTLMQTAPTGYWVKVKNARVTEDAAVTVSPGGTETIDSNGVILVSGSVSLPKFGNEITLAKVGSSWSVIGSVSSLGEVDIPDLQASKITRGEFALDRIPVLSLEKIPVLTADKIPELSANKITSDELSLDRIPNITATKLPDASTTAKGIVQLAAADDLTDDTNTEVPTVADVHDIIGDSIGRTLLLKSFGTVGTTITTVDTGSLITLDDGVDIDDYSSLMFIWSTVSGATRYYRGANIIPVSLIPAARNVNLQFWSSASIIMWRPANVDDNQLRFEHITGDTIVRLHFVYGIT